MFSRVMAWEGGKTLCPVILHAMLYIGVRGEIEIDAKGV